MAETMGFEQYIEMFKSLYLSNNSVVSLPLSLPLFCFASNFVELFLLTHSHLVDKMKVQKGDRIMTKLLIAMPAECRINALTSILDERWDIHTCTDGYATIDTMKYINPEAMVLALNMPRKDGLSILKECFPDIPPATLAISPLINEYVMQTCISLGVKYIMPMVYNTEELRDRLEEICESIHNTPTAVMQHLSALGFASHTDGCRYLLAVLPAFAEDKSRRLHKEIYPIAVDLCRANDTQCVERSIGRAINNAWENRDKKMWSKYFPLNKDGDIDRPTNKQFLDAVARKMR